MVTVIMSHGIAVTVVMLHNVVVVVAVIAPHVVLQLWLLCCMCCMVLWSWSQLLCHVWCCSCSRHAVHGVTGAVIMLHLVLWLPSSHHVWSHVCCYCATLVLQFLSSCHTWCRRHCHCAVFSVAVAVIALHIMLWSW